MPSPIVPPPSVPFGGSINALPVANVKPPQDHRKAIPANILWQTDAPTNFCVSFNVGSQQIVTIDKIRGLYVDNTRCGVNARIYFSDTQFVLDVAPYTAVFAPVVTNLLNFVIYLTSGLFGLNPITPAPSAVDATYLNILNYEPEPAVINPGANAAFTTIYESIYKESGTLTSTSQTSLSGSQNISPGFLQNVFVAISGTFDAGAKAVISIYDFDSFPVTIYYIGATYINQTDQVQAVSLLPIINLSNLNIPLNGNTGPAGAGFTNRIGLSVVITGTVSINVSTNIMNSWPLV